MTSFIHLSACFSVSQFLCALPRRDGYEFFVGQWTGTELHFTALINIQVGDVCPTKHIVRLEALPGVGVQNSADSNSACCAADVLPSLRIGWLSRPQYQIFEVRIPFSSFTLFHLLPQPLWHLLHVSKHSGSF